MDAGDTTGMLFQKYHRISALGHSVASVELNDDFLLRSVKERVPGQLAVERREFDAVVVVADAHRLRLRFVCDFIEMVRRFQPALARLGVFRRQARHDEELVAKRLVELDRFRQIISKQCVQAEVRSAALKADFVEQLAQGLRVPVVVAGELDRLVAHLRDRRHGANQVFRTLVAHRIKLEGEWNLVAPVGVGSEQISRRSGCDRSGGSTGFEKLSPGECFGFHNCRKKCGAARASGSTIYYQRLSPVASTQSTSTTTAFLTRQRALLAR